MFTTEIVATEKRVRLGLILPRSLVSELRRLVPARQRSQFVAEAIAQRIAVLKLQRALQDARGAWRDEDHPELSVGVDEWLSEMRARDLARLSEEDLDAEHSASV